MAIFFKKLPYVGWLAPDGTHYPLEPFEHIKFAAWLCEKHNVVSYSPEETLLLHGWVQIQCGQGQYHATWKKTLTYAQFIWLQEKIDNECPEDWHILTVLQFDNER